MRSNNNIYIIYTIYTTYQCIYNILMHVQYTNAYTIYQCMNEFWSRLLVHNSTVDKCGSCSLFTATDYPVLEK